MSSAPPVAAVAPFPFWPSAIGANRAAASPAPPAPTPFRKVLRVLFMLHLKSPVQALCVVACNLSALRKYLCALQSSNRLTARTIDKSNAGSSGSTFQLVGTVIPYGFDPIAALGEGWPSVLRGFARRSHLGDRRSEFTRVARIAAGEFYSLGARLEVNGKDLVLRQRSSEALHIPLHVRPLEATHVINQLV